MIADDLARHVSRSICTPTPKPPPPPGALSAKLNIVSRYCSPSDLTLDKSQPNKTPKLAIFLGTQDPRTNR